MRRSRLIVALVTAGVSATFLSSPASFADSIPPESSHEATRGPIIDPDQQIIDARASQARSNGAMKNAPDPGYKAGSPATNLKQYPKFTAAQLAKMAQDDAARAATTPGPEGENDYAGEVESSEILSDGSVAVTTYTPAPGVTPEELATALREDGEPNVEVIDHEDGQDHNRAAAAAGPSADACSWYAARSITCPNSFWANHSFADPRVRFNDHTSAAWPVTNAVYKWNQTPNIDSYYLRNSCPFQAGARCVDVYSGNYGASDWVGLATRKYDPGTPQSGRFAEQGHFVQLNDYYNPGSSFTRNNVATHELGHILGLGHNTSSNDVLYYVANLREDVGGQNPVLLSGIYSVPR
jgi:Matrixin